LPLLAKAQKQSTFSRLVLDFQRYSSTHYLFKKKYNYLRFLKQHIKNTHLIYPDEKKQKQKRQDYPVVFNCNPDTGYLVSLFE
jgi:hypothetical protein